MIYFKENFVWAVRDLNPRAKCIIEQFTYLLNIHIIFIP